MPQEVVRLGDFQCHAGKTLDQGVEGFAREYVSELGSLAMLGDVLGSAAEGAGQLVGVFYADTFDQ
ncbi:hypothetical protein D3C73_1648750 [compost metagenome]